MTDNPLDKMPLSELAAYDKELFAELASPGAQGLLGPDIIRQKSELRVALAGEMLRRNGIDPAGDSNDRMRSDGALPAPPVDPAPALPSLQHIRELTESVAGLDDTSPKYCAVMARVAIDQSIIDEAAKAAETPPDAAA